MTAHPRVCGADSLRSAESHPVRGSSPRVRGRLDMSLYSVLPQGLIPACAGQT